MRDMGDAAPMGAARVGRLGAIAVAGMLALTGCQAEPAPPATEPVTGPIETASAAPAPSFASDEEALAAGVAALQAELNTELALLGQPGDHSVAFGSVATGEQLEYLTTAHERALAEGFTYRGEVFLTDTKFQSSHQNGSTTVVTFYACVNTSKLERIDANGVPIQVNNSSGKSYVVVTTEHTASVSLVATSDTWTGPSGCS